MKSNYLIILFGFTKLLVHLIFNTTYGLHRDEYLYYAEGQHLSWGYMEGPPLIALLANVASWFGDSAFVLRLFPALTGTLTIVIIGLMVKELGGKKWAIFFTCLALLISPVYLRSNMLFQPVSFNQFFWMLSLMLVILIIKKKDKKYWYALGATIGLGIMTKYSIVFLLLPLFIFSLLNPELRRWYKTKEPWLAIIIATLIATPNILWQFHHNLPVIEHMNALTASQLINVSMLDFVRDQFLNHLSVSLIWLAGLLYLLLGKGVREFRVIGFSYLGLILLLVMMSGKSYYSMGVYSTLFIFGGLAIEKFVKGVVYKIILAAYLVLSLLPFIPYALPVLSIDKMESYCLFMDKTLGLSAPIIWENGQKYSIPQDYADMRGWEDMVARVARVYHGLNPEEKANCNIWGGGYGHAGAINFYRNKYNLPEAVSLNASFMIWCPIEADFTTQILVDDVWQNGSSYFGNFAFIDSSEIRLARDPGYIYLKKEPIVNIPDTWRELVKAEKDKFNF